MLETVSSRKKSLFPTTASLLELKDYSVRFKQRFILKNLNLGIAIKEITFILGASGSGKTTLLRSLHKKNSLAQVTGERSLAQGACVMLMDEKDILLPDFLAIEHLQMVYEEKVHHDWEAFKREALNLFQHFNLSPLLSHKLKTWSQSEKQKLKLLLSLLASPDLLLLDNPFALLSREDAMKFLSLLAEVHLRKNMSMVITVKDRDYVSILPSRLLFLDQGQLTISRKNL